MATVLALAGCGGADAPGDGSAAAGFARDMSDHHAQAVEMAETMRDRTEDGDLRLLAADIALTQQAQIGRMRGWLDIWGLAPTSAEPVMAWSSMKHGEMPGMASRDEMNELRRLPVADAERRFLQLMIAHHQGGVRMAAAAVDEDVPDVVRRLAEAIIDAQQSEIGALRAMLEDREA